MIRIVIEGRPTAWKRPGNKNGMYFDRQLTEKNFFRLKLKSQYQKPPLNEPVSVRCTFAFKVPKSASKVRKMALLKISHFSSRPDLDNLLKWIGDASQGVLWEDDCQIVKFENVEKIWAEEEKTIIEFDVVGRDDDKCS